MKRWIALATLLASISCSTAHAFVVFKFNGKPLTMRAVMRTQGSIKWRILGECPQILRESMEFAVRTWSDSCGAAIAFSENNSDAILDVLWDESGTQIEHGYLGYSTMQADADGNTCYARIIVNAKAYTWHRNPELDGCNGNSINLDTVMLHEVGHILGLDHADLDPSSIVGAYDPTNLPTMWSLIYNGLRTLHDDDIAGMRALYSDAPAAPPLLILAESSRGKSRFWRKKRPIKFSITVPCGETEWFFGDGTYLKSNASEPAVHTYIASGRYTITAKCGGMSGSLELEINKKGSRRKTTAKFSPAKPPPG